ncbi:MAG: sugar nucleotide-binding protein, partial [Oxalobacteraceae bacterium]
QAIQAAGIPYLILRTSWVYGMRGKNFLLTVLRLAQERDELRIVGDQHGAPTWCRTIADTTAHILAQSSGAKDMPASWQETSGLYHLTAQGQTTWAGFTEAILANATLPRKPTVTHITTHEYPLPTKRPSYSVMSCEKLMSTLCGLPTWEKTLKLCQD